MNTFTLTGVVTAAILLSACKNVEKAWPVTETAAAKPPNVLFIMSDDQGWGDVGYNGNPVLKTPHLDAMAAEGVRLDRFYAAAPVCSPTRGNVLTGRHPFRLGIPWAGAGHLPADETTLAEVLKERGYRTGHFGKWHVGELSLTINQSEFPGDMANNENYSPPWENGFDVSFSTESMVPTYNPYYHVGGRYGEADYRMLQTVPIAHGQQTSGARWPEHYWIGPGRIADEWLEGDDSEIIVDRAATFIGDSAAQGQPFLAVVWFHTPHTPLVAGDEDRAPYADQPMPAQHWYGAVSAMDRQIGRLRKLLRDLGQHENTLVWFNSDNGPSYVHDFNSAGPFSGKKSELKEGGIRVPAIIEWPAVLTGGRVVAAPISTSDIYPTVVAAVQAELPDGQKELDGQNVLPLLSGELSERSAPIAFQSPQRARGTFTQTAKHLSYALSGNRYKLASYDSGENWELYDLTEDPAEAKNIAATHGDIVESMNKTLMAWVVEVERDAARLVTD